GFLGAGRPSMAGASPALGSIMEMGGYFRAVLPERRRSPPDDLLSSPISAEDPGPILSEQEVVSPRTHGLFCAPGNNTHPVGTGLLSLLGHPDELEALRDAPALAPNAIEELLRHASPVQRQGRIALTDIEIAGQTIPKGHRVWLVIGAANRDPAQFSDPDRL